MEDVVTGADSRLGFRKYGVLVVDDDAAVLDALNFGLRQKNFRVWQAADGRGALKTYWRYRERIDLVLLDVRMPGLDGPQTLLRLRKLSSRVHCCFMSGDLGGYAGQALLDMGAMAVFLKPLYMIDLAEKLMEIVSDPRLNPSFTEMRQRTIRRGPVSRAPAPSLTFVARDIKRARAPVEFHADHQLRWTGRDEG